MSASTEGRIFVPYEDEEREQILQKIEKLLQKFGLEEQTGTEVNQVLSDYFAEQKRFSIFSREAYSIRNNQLDQKHINDFRTFTQVLNDKMPRVLYPLQLLSSYHLAFSQNACNFSVPGSGKTSIVYGAYAFLNSLPRDHMKYVDKLVIIGPLSSFGPWESEYTSCFGRRPESKRLSAAVPRAQKVTYFYSEYPAQLTLISYNGVVALAEDLVYFLKKHPTMIVLDEAHKIKNIQGGVIASTVLSLAQHCKSRVVLTGTPAPNGYEDLLNLFKFIWPSRDIIRFYPFHLEEMSSNPDDPRIAALVDQVSPYFVRIRKSDLNIPDPVEHPPIVIEMGEVQKEIYQFVEKSYLDYLMTSDVSPDFQSVLRRARLVRLMQASTNPSLLKRPLDEFLHEAGITDDIFIDDTRVINNILSYDRIEVPEKFKAAAKIVDKLVSDGNKVVVWAIFRQNLVQFQDYLNSVGIPSRLLYGKTPIENNEADDDIETRESIIREFHRDDSPFKVIIANPFAVSESISLHKACKHAVYIERSFNAAHFIQSKDRIHRYGLKPDEKINYYYILSSNVTDLTIHERLLAKEKAMIAIIENEPIPLFGRIASDDDKDDINALIKNYARETARIR